MSKSGKTDGNVQTFHDKKAKPIPKPRPTPGKKDTKKWCKGKVGVEHVLGWEPVRWSYAQGVDRNLNDVTFIHTCTLCGKQFEYCGLFGVSPKRCQCGNHTETREEREIRWDAKRAKWVSEFDALMKAKGKKKK